MSEERTVLALGFFDGIHLGHAALLHRAVEMARELQATPAAMTFDVHPDTLVTGQSVPLINSARDRVELIRELSGIEDVIFLHFTTETMRQPWREFLDRFTRDHQVAGYVVGHDFRFGWKGEGNGVRLRQYCADHGLAAAVIPAVTLGGEIVSSTLIRSVLERGDVHQAARLLGHPHRLSGIASEGFMPWPAEVIALPEGRYAVRLSGSRAEARDAVVTVESRGVRLPEGLRGDISLDFSAAL